MTTQKIINALQTHAREEGSVGFYLALGLFLGGAIYLKYGLHLDTYFYNDPWQLAKGLAFYAVPYFVAVLAYVALKNKWYIFRELGFWVLSAACLFVLVANKYLQFYKPYLAQNPETYPFLRLVVFNLHIAFFYALIPLLFCFFGRDHQQSRWFGFTLKGFHSKPYVLMLLIMLPLLVWASYQPDFLWAYPRYKPGITEGYWQISPVYTVATFELSYILAFVCLEWFFRGFMVMRLEKYLGAGSVFPMVAVYAFIHFGKPLAETMGSVFGGYILGVVALRTRSVFGGILIHVGVALLMELLAYVQIKM